MDELLQSSEGGKVLSADELKTEVKIKNGIIRIENGRLVGLGLTRKESLSINELDDLFSYFGPKEAGDTIDRAILGIGRVGLFMHNCPIDASEIVDDIMISMLPGDGDLYGLSVISKIFKA